MRPVVLLLTAGLLTSGCSGQTSTAPSGVPAAPATGSSAAALIRIWLCCGSNQITINGERQIEARATYGDGSIKDITNAVTSWRSSNPQVATISSTGVVKGLAAGNFDIFASYQDLEAKWDLYVFVPSNHVRPDEVVGWVRELTINGEVSIPRPEVEVVGGASDGRKVIADLGGFFRISGLRAPGFDLIVRERGYSSKRFRVNELARDVSADTVMTPAPTVVSDVLEGPVCWPTRTISTTFTPTLPGFLRITGARYLSTIRAVYADGVLINSFLTDNTDVETRAEVKYELRVTGSCDYTPGENVRLTFLRPR